MYSIALQWMLRGKSTDTVDDTLHERMQQNMLTKAELHAKKNAIAAHYSELLDLLETLKSQGTANGKTAGNILRQIQELVNDIELAIRPPYREILAALDLDSLPLGAYESLLELMQEYYETHLADVLEQANGMEFYRIGHDIFNIFAHIPMRLDLLMRKNRSDAVSGEEFGAEIDVITQLLNGLTPLFDQKKFHQVYVDQSNLALSPQLERSIVEEYASVAQLLTSLQDATDVAFPDHTIVWMHPEGMQTKELSKMKLPQIYRALFTVIENAAKYARPGTTIIVDAEIIQLSAGDGVPYLSVAVQDEGPGIPRDKREQVFEVGTRLEQTAWTAGTGFGLAVARAYIESHTAETAAEMYRGTIRIQEPGVYDALSHHSGTRVVTRLPLAFVE